MNLLSHYVFSRGDLDDPFYVVGLIYPDLVRKRNPVFLGNTFRKGVREHIELDRRFHSINVFEDACEKIPRVLPERIFGRPLLAHIGIEMAIDRIILELDPRGVKDKIKRVIRSLGDEVLRELYDVEEGVEEKVRNILDRKIIERPLSFSGSVRSLREVYDRVRERYSFLPEQPFHHFEEIYERCLVEVNEKKKIISKFYNRFAPNNNL